MGRYSQSSWENPEDPPFWAKALLALLAFALLYGVLQWVN